MGVGKDESDAMLADGGGPLLEGTPCRMRAGVGSLERALDRCVLLELGFVFGLMLGGGTFVMSRCSTRAPCILIPSYV